MYTCPTDPEIGRERLGNCAICSTALEPMDGIAAGSNHGLIDTITTGVNDAPTLAAAAMRLLSVSVITNPLPLRRVKLDA